MKTFYFLLAILICFYTGISNAQKTDRGIFLSAEDFLNNKLTHASSHTHIKLHEIFHKDIIEVKIKDSSYTYLKKDVYGYRDHEGNIFRIYNGKTYPVLNPSETILIYKVAEGPAQKGQTPIYFYYFSKDATKEILPLSMGYFENEFNDNKPFQDMLEIHFTNTNSLLEYDSMHKMYKVNRLLELARNRMEN